MPDKARLETARIVLALDAAIAAFRAGESSGVRALDSASRLLDDLADDAASEHAGRADGQRRQPSRPDRVELAILTALADTYGADMLTNTSMGMRCGWSHGAVGLRSCSACCGASRHRMRNCP